MPKTPPEVQDALDVLAREIEPEAWAEYDAGNGVCSRMAGTAALHSITVAKNVLKRWPEIGDVVLPGRGVTATIHALRGPKE